MKRATRVLRDVAAEQLKSKKLTRRLEMSESHSAKPISIRVRNVVVPPKVTPTVK